VTRSNYQDTLGGFDLFRGFLPGRESNPGCWNGNPASYHCTTQRLLKLCKILQKGP